MLLDRIKTALRAHHHSNRQPQPASPNASRPASAFSLLETLEPRMLLSATWDNVELSGGGYISAIHVHPQDGNVIYARTDMGGLYQVDRSADRMNQLLDFLPAEQQDLYGVSGVALHPTNTNQIFATLGKYEERDSAVIYSNNRGQDWKFTSLNNLSQDGNINDGRLGQRLAYNPANTNELLVGSDGDGLWRYDIATDSGVRLTSIPSDADDRIQSVVFNPANPSEVYVAVVGRGIYRNLSGTSDAFTPISGGSTGALDMEISRDGDHLVVSDSSGIYRLDNPRTSSSWTNVTPPGNFPPFNTIDFSPHDDDTLITANGFFNSIQTGISLSTDAGTSWTNLNSVANNQVSWQPAKFPGSAISDFEWDPSNANRVYFSDWYNFWETDDINAGTVQWSNPNHTGHNQLVPMALAVPKSGNTDGIQLYSGHADVGGFRHTDLSNDPAQSTGSNGVEDLIDIGDIGVSSADPNRVYLTAIKKENAQTSHNLATWSASQNQWVNLPGDDPNWGLSRIAVSNQNADRLVLVTANGGVQYSTDGGQSFQAGAGGPSSADMRMSGGYWNWVQPLGADGGNNQTFYIYSQAEGSFYRSTDGGANWSVRSTGLPQPFIYRWTVEGVPGQANKVYLGLANEGLRYSDDGGQSWQNLSNVQSAINVSVGAPKPGTNVETVFIVGRANGAPDQRVYMSTDRGATWTTIGTTEAGLGNSPYTMAADPDRYGVVYIGTDGRGVIVGDVDGVLGTGSSGGSTPPGNGSGGGSTSGGNNLITNGTFENLNGWQPQIAGNAQGSITIDPGNSLGGGQSMRAQLSAAGTDRWMASLTHNGVSLTPGETYTLSFEARASVDGRQLDAYVANLDNGWTGFDQQLWGLSLTTSAQTYTLQFTPDRTSGDVTFRFGDAAGSVWIDDVTLVSDSATANPSLITNGSFDSLNGWDRQFQNGAAGSASIDSGNALGGGSSFKATTTTAGAARWQARLQQTDIALTPGQTYTLTFKARASTPGRPINVFFENLTGGWTGFDNQLWGLSLSTQAQTYSLTFTPDRNSATLNFQFGDQLGDLWIDDVELLPV
ncbi:MAG: carbohydrate binding domain-containing protein [Planctomycetota bacterium]